MRAAVTRVFGDPLVIEELTLDPPQRGEARVRVAAVAICGSDIHAADGAWGGELPAVFGHEAAGVVAEVGPEVSSVGVGDHVVVSLLRSCGECFYCRSGQRHHCEAVFALDERTPLRDGAGRAVTQGIAVGAFAEEVVVHASQLAVIPPDLPLASASLLACGVPTGYGAVVTTAAVPAGASVAVIGVGGVGINCIQGARAVGASPIIAIDSNPAKLDVAGRFGATLALAPGHDLGGDVAAATGGRGADFVFVAVGNPVAVESGFELVRPGGTLVVVGMSEAGVHARFEMSNLAYGGKRVLGSRLGSTDVARDTPTLVQRYQAGALMLDELISGRFPLEHINQAIELVRRGEALRNVIVFAGAAP